MRKPTPHEIEEWRHLAERHGHLILPPESYPAGVTGRPADPRSIVPGRFTVRAVDENTLLLTLVTPLPAREHTLQHQRKHPPIQFDRTPSGEIIIPIEGSGFASVFEAAAELSDLSTPRRAVARDASRLKNLGTAPLPADTDTVEWTFRDENGQDVVFESLPPGTSILITLTTEERGGAAR